MTLVETNLYFLKVALFAHHFHRGPTMFGIGHMAVAGSAVIYDQLTPDGWHIFHCIDKDNPGLYVKVPDYLVAEQISDDSKDYLFANTPDPLYPHGQIDPR